MASVWGVSWGRAWGNSWGIIAVATAAPATGGWVEWPGWRRQKELERLKTELELTPEQREVLEIAAKSAVEDAAIQKAKNQAFDETCYDLLQERIAYQRQEALRQELLRIGAITAAAELQRQQELEDEGIVLRFLFEIC